MKDKAVKIEFFDLAQCPRCGETDRFSIIIDKSFEIKSVQCNECDTVVNIEEKYIQ